MPNLHVVTSSPVSVSASGKVKRLKKRKNPLDPVSAALGVYQAVDRDNKDRARAAKKKRKTKAKVKPRKKSNAKKAKRTAKRPTAFGHFGGRKSKKKSNRKPKAKRNTKPKTKRKSKSKKSRSKR